MLKNIELTNGLIYAENVSLALADKIGKIEAHELIEYCCRQVQREGIGLKNLLTKNVIVTKYFTASEFDNLFDPIGSTGLSDEYIRRVVSQL